MKRRPTFPRIAKRSEAREDHAFFPQPILRQVHIDRREHAHRRERAHAAAAFGDLEVKAAIASRQRGAHRLDADSDELGEQADRAGDDELQSEGRLLQRGHRDHENQGTRRGKAPTGRRVFPRERDTAP